MTTQQQDIVNIAISLYRATRDLADIPKFCLSRKKNKKTSKVYLYIQYPAAQGRKQVKIKANEEAHYLDLFDKRQTLEVQLHELKSQYNALSFTDRKNVRFLFACYRWADAADVGKVEKNTYLDGTTRDSKSELCLSLLLDMLGVKYKYNYPLYAQNHFYLADFFFPDSQDFHEHMGMLDHEPYAQNQKRKLEDYKTLGIQEKKNLLITKEHFEADPQGPEKKHAYIDLREVILQLTAFGKISPQKTFQLLFPDKPLPHL